MRLLIPTMDTDGAQALMSGHFGRAPFYALADTDTGAVLAVSNPSVEHAPGNCVPASQALGPGSYQAVVCQGIGAGAIARLTQAGIPVYVHKGPDVAAAIEAFRAGTLRLAGEGDGCGGGSGSCGGHGHGGHGHSHGDATDGPAGHAHNHQHLHTHGAERN